MFAEETLVFNRTCIQTGIFDRDLRTVNFRLMNETIDRQPNESEIKEA